MRPSLRWATSVAHAFAAALLLAACASSATEPPTTTGPRLTVTPLGNNGLPLTSSSGLSTAQRTVVRDAATWRDVWNTIWARSTPIPALPDVDFSREMIVIAALGERNSGGFGIHVDSATTDATGAAVVWVRSVSPGPTCTTPAVITQPVDAARLPLVAGAVTFREQSQITDCR